MSEQTAHAIETTFTYCVIYIFGIEDEAHRNRLKIGETTIGLAQSAADIIPPNDETLNKAAHHRIRQYTATADVPYQLLWTELGLAVEYDSKEGAKRRVVRDHDVHRVLQNSGIEKKSLTRERNTGEWFFVDLATAKNAIAAAKRGDAHLSGAQITHSRQVITLRPEQRAAVDLTKKRFKSKDAMLWDAKMRFGKTVSALTVAKEMSFVHTIIITHRPVVSEGWFEDFTKIFYEEDTDWRFGGRNKYTLKQLNDLERKGVCGHYVYFASIQDLRGAKAVDGKFDKDWDIFENRWDYLVIDEAHEGTKTQLAQHVLALLQGDETKTLYLSGTPFNLYDDFEDKGGIYTWDYVAEQQSKANWDIQRPGEPNPYRSLPSLCIYTYQLSDYFRDQYPDIEDKAFNFREFFRTYAEKEELPEDYRPEALTIHEPGDRPRVGDFVHEDDVWAFLNLITRLDEHGNKPAATHAAAQTNFPFSTEEFRGYLRHTLWMVPGVKEARALSALLKKHPVFQHFNIANVAGAGDEERSYDDALALVNQAIGKHPEASYSITISCGKLTTGVTVKPWTGVLMLSNMSAPATYLQTMFRVQSPATIDGQIKERCYAFDFAPDRTLKLVAEASRLRTTAGATNSPEQKDRVGEFLNYCPIIAVNGSKMSAYDVNKMMRELKKAAAQSAVRNGFDDASIYSERLFELTDDEVRLFNNLNSVIGKTKAQKKAKDVTVNAQGFDEEQYASARKKKREGKKLTPEEEAALKARREQLKQRESAIAILRGISIRIPMMIYGADVPVDEAINPDTFVELVDDESWEEFMPAGVTKTMFREFSQFYDADVFIEAGNQIRRKALAADDELPEDRIRVIGEIFAGFRNPDKETVLTPWRVVNMHLGNTLGGWNFFDSLYEMELDTRDAEGNLELRRIGYVQDEETVAKKTFGNPDTTYLEINSKSGLYALLCTYNSYAAKVEQYADGRDYVPATLRMGFWNEALQQNVYVVCRTPMARSITERTLRGFRQTRVNCAYVSDPVEKIQAGCFNAELATAFGLKETDMKFDVIVGNPPYQEAGGSGGDNDAPIYQHFVRCAEELNPDYISLVIPSRWFSGGRERLLGDFRYHMLHNDSIRKLYDYPESRDIFKNVEIKGGVCYFLIDNSYHGKCETHLVENGEDIMTMRDLGKLDVYVRRPMSATIVGKIPADARRVDEIVSADTPFGIPTNPKVSKKTPFDVFDESAPDHDVLLYYNEKNVRLTGYVRRSDLRKNAGDIDRPKAIFPLAGWGGNDPNVLGEPIAAPVHSVCSQTYLYAAFDSADEVNNFIRYYKTRFFRFLISAVKITQHALPRYYHYIPMQDFTGESDIDWTADREALDEQLFDKYGFTREERDFICERVNLMP